MVFSTRAFFLSALASALAEGPGKPSQCPRYRDKVFIGAYDDNSVAHGESQVGVAKTISEQNISFFFLRQQTSKLLVLKTTSTHRWGSWRPYSLPQWAGPPTKKFQAVPRRCFLQILSRKFRLWLKFWCRQGTLAAKEHMYIPNCLQRLAGWKSLCY